jgi:drug/metabolite transporter (DMT)-like permease
VPDRKTQLDAVAVTSLAACCFLWGLNQVAVKTVLPQVPPLAQAGLRSAGAVLLVFGWARLRGIPLFERDGTLWPGLFAGSLFAAEFACIFIGLQHTTASRMAVFIYLSPFIVALGMPFIARNERLTAPQLAGLVIAFAGVAWAFAEGFSRPAAGDRQWFGDALGVAAAVLWGATTLVIRSTPLGRATPEKALLYQLGMTAAALGAASFAVEPAWAWPLAPLTWASLGFQMVVVSFASYLLWFWLVRHYAATRLAAFTMLTPVFGLLLGALLLGEPITLRLVTALAAVAVGIVLVNRVR